MPLTDKIPTAVTGVCGEHFVAAKLSGMGYVVALPRGGSPAVDLLVSSVDGKKSIAVQVKTAKAAWKNTKDKEHWEWAISAKAEGNISDTLFYAFVDLKGWPKPGSLPDVFIAPSATISEAAKYARENNWSRFFWWLSANEGEKYLEKWEILQTALQ